MAELNVLRGVLTLLTLGEENSTLRIVFHCRVSNVRFSKRMLSIDLWSLYEVICCEEQNCSLSYGHDFDWSKKIGVGQVYVTFCRLASFTKMMGTWVEVTSI